MIPAVSQRLKLTAENSITIVSKLVGKAPIFQIQEKKKKKKETQIEKLKEIYIYRK